MRRKTPGSTPHQILSPGIIIYAYTEGRIPCQIARNEANPNSSEGILSEPAPSPTVPESVGLEALVPVIV
jgi:hypothetical protein